MTEVKVFLIFPVAAFYLAAMARCVGAGELVSDSQCGSGGLKQGIQITFAVGEAEEQVLCSEYTASKRRGVNSSIAVY